MDDGDWWNVWILKRFTGKLRYDSPQGVDLQGVAPLHKGMTQ